MDTAQSIIHIGYHKTATTWFQKCFWPLMESHRQVPRRQIREAILAPPGMLFNANLARQMLTESKDDRPLILSEENLSGYIHNNGLHGLMGPEAAHRLYKLFPSAHVVIFIRSQSAMIHASYAQYIRSGGTNSLLRYVFPAKNIDGALRHPFKVPLFGWTHFRYLELIKIYLQLFGKENVHVYLFEDFSENSTEFIKNLCFDLKLRIPDRLKLLPPTNLSWDQKTLAVARFLNHFTCKSVNDKKYLIHIPRWYETNQRWLDKLDRIWRDNVKKRLPYKVIEEVHKNYALSNTQLIQLLNLPLYKYDYSLSEQSHDLL